MSLFSSPIRNLEVIFDKEEYIFGTDTSISGHISWLNSDDATISIETVYWASTETYSNPTDQPDYNNSLIGEQIHIDRASGYRFEIPLLYPNIDSWEDSTGMDTYTYIYTFLRVAAIHVVVPVTFEKLNETRDSARTMLEKIAKNLTEEEQRYEVSAWTNIKELFIKRVLANNLEPGMTRLPWNLGDSVNEEYYFSIVNSSIFWKLAHITYLYNFHFYIYFSLICYTIFIVLYTTTLTKFTIDSYFIIELFLIFIALLIGMSQYFLRKSIYPSQYFLALKKDTELDWIFDKDSISIHEIMEEQKGEINFLSSTWWSITIYLQSYFHFRYYERKYWYSHLENLYVKQLIQKKFSSHKELLWFQIDLDTSFPLLKKRKDLEWIGIYTWLSIQIDYDQYPDKDYAYNLDRYKS